jgi:hypothetical protein
VAKLLNRAGQRLCVLESLSIAQPVGRSGVRFHAQLPAFALQGFDPLRLRFFIVQDDDGNRYSITIERITTLDSTRIEISGMLVATG